MAPRVPLPPLLAVALLFAVLPAVRIIFVTLSPMTGHGGIFFRSKIVQCKKILEDIENLEDPLENSFTQVLEAVRTYCAP